MYQKYIDELKKQKASTSELRFVALQLLELHIEALKRNNVQILELGVYKGQSTRVFLNAIHNKESSKLISIDIKDYSNVCSSSKWNFIKSSSLDINYVLKKEPDIIKKGIDILYIDSLHKREHVQNELFLYYPFMNKDSVIFFDDIDSGPYMINQRKDSIGTEIENRAILELINSIFYTNINDINLSLYKGSTGLARIDKLSPRGNTLKEPKKYIKRNNKILWKLIYLFLGKREYRPKFNKEKEFLIEVID